MTNEAVVIVWKYGDTVGGFHCFPVLVSKFIEDTYNTKFLKDEFINLTALNLKGFLVNIKRLIVIKDSATSYSLKRTYHTMDSAAASGLRWQVEEMKDAWKDYPLEFCDYLEQAKNIGLQKVRKNEECIVDISSMLQLNTNKAPKKLRRIITESKYTNYSKYHDLVSEASNNKIPDECKINTQAINRKMNDEKMVGKSTRKRDFKDVDWENVSKVDNKERNTKKFLPDSQRFDNLFNNQLPQNSMSVLSKEQKILMQNVTPLNYFYKNSKQNILKQRSNKHISDEERIAFLQLKNPQKHETSKSDQSKAQEGLVRNHPLAYIQLAQNEQKIQQNLMEIPYQILPKNFQFQPVNEFQVNPLSAKLSLQLTNLKSSMPQFQQLHQSYWHLKLPLLNNQYHKFPHLDFFPPFMQTLLPAHLPPCEKITLDDCHPSSLHLWDPKCFEFLMNNQFMKEVEDCPNEICPICLDDLKGVSPYREDDQEINKTLKMNKCNHLFHYQCLKTMYENGNKDGSIQCPQCKSIHGTKYGNCPAGVMEVAYRKGSLPGFPESDFIIDISYIVCSGIQTTNHPNPGHSFTTLGFPRHGYLPGTAKGLKVLKLLKEAWQRRLTFTIGTSATTGAHNTVIWNEIHHKTEVLNTRGHGYPDPNYLDNVLEELALQGVIDEEVDNTTENDDIRQISSFTYNVDNSRSNERFFNRV